MPDDIMPIADADDRTPDPEEAELVAYLDGELDAATARRVESRLAADPGLRARATALKKTFDLLDFLPRPEPSSGFTSKTLEKIPAVQAAPVSHNTSLTPPLASAVTITNDHVPPPARFPTRGRIRVLLIAVVVAAGLAVTGGYVGVLAARAFRDPRPGAPPVATTPPLTTSPSDSRVIRYLPLYAGADDLEFVQRLAEMEPFRDSLPPDGPARSDWGGLPQAGPQFDQLAAAFAALPAERQAQHRQLDQELHRQPEVERDRLFRALEGYAAWLRRLPEADRRAVLEAPTAAHRLHLVRRLQEREWRAGLPERVRVQPAWAEQWRQNGAEQRWALGLGRPAQNATGATPWPFDDPKLTEQVIEYARTAYRPNDPEHSRLTPDEAAWLRTALEEGKKGGTWVWYGKAVYELSRRYEMLPVPPSGKTVTTWDDLQPAQVREAIRRVIEPRLQGTVKANIDARAGKWPDFALALDAEFMKPTSPFGPQFPRQLPVLGPCRPADFADKTREFITQKLLREATPAEIAELKRVEGKWPEYPRKLIQIARSRNLSVPGAMLPGPPNLWEQTYNPAWWSDRPASQPARKP